jgi:MOSC domain-containing protein YiiM
MSYRPIKENRDKKLVGSVVGLFISKDSVDEMSLDEGGVLGDKFYAKEKARSVLISTIYSYKLAKDKDISLEYGELGENIILDYNPYHLDPNSKIQIGDSVILEISQHCTLCKSLTKIDNRLPKLLKNDRGIFAKVISGGKIKNRDRVYIL